MDVTQVNIVFDGGRDSLAPGDELAGAITLGAINIHDVRALELSILWYTEGKGEEDLAVHYFQRFDAGGGQPLVNEPLKFSVRLPQSPLSYEGLIVRVRWCVRLRLFTAMGKEIVVDRPFRLGKVPPIVENGASQDDQAALRSAVKTV